MISSTRLIGTEVGAVICHICLPLRVEGSNISESFEQESIVIFAALNPEGGSYEGRELDVTGLQLF